MSSFAFTLFLPVERKQAGWLFDWALINPSTSSLDKCISVITHLIWISDPSKPFSCVFYTFYATYVHTKACTMSLLYYRACEKSLLVTPLHWQMCMMRTHHAMPSMWCFVYICGLMNLFFATRVNKHLLVIGTSNLRRKLFVLRSDMATVSVVRSLSPNQHHHKIQSGHQ